MLKRKLIELVLIRIIDAHIKNILTITSFQLKIERFIFERIKIIRSLDSITIVVFI